MPDTVLEADSRTQADELSQVVGQVRATARVNLRPGGPTLQDLAIRTLEPGTDLFVTEVVDGEVVSGNGRWYHCLGLGYVWSGACGELRAFDAEAARSDDEPDRPERHAAPLVSEPEFRLVENVVHKDRGPRANGLEGLIVHFDASRTQPDSDVCARNVLRYGAGQGHHYGAISRTGRIYLPQGFAWENWGYHAGKSVCPTTGRKGVSRYYVGFELNNPGRLHQAQEDGVFCPWFNARRDKHGRVILDENGRCTRISDHGEWYREYELRFAEGGNIQAGWYLPFSREQFDALTDLCLWLAQAHAESFSLDRVFGHDEVSPGRKSDPGGAMGWPDTVMTMPEFRAYLADLA